jgi:hypothetical protein
MEAALPMGLATAPRSQRVPRFRRSSTQTRPPIRSILIRVRWYLFIPALYCALTVLLLWPLVQHVRSAVADTIGDPLLNAWTLRWVQHALVTDPLHLYNGNMFAPNPRSLAFSEALIPQALLAWPIWLITHDSLLAYNLGVLITYPLCAVGMYALCRALNANRGAAFLAGLLYAFVPFRMDNNAHLQVLSMQWMPLAFLAVIRFMQSGSREGQMSSLAPRPSFGNSRTSRLWLRGAAVTAAMTLLALSSVYYAVMFATGFGAFLIVEAIRQRRQFLTRTGLGLLVALGIAAGIVATLDRPYLIMRQEQGITRTLDEAYDDAAHKHSYLTVTPGSVLWRHVLPTSGTERSALFPGALLTILALIGLRGLRRPWVMGIALFGLVGLVLSFGPTWGDKETGIPLPYRVLFKHIIGYQGLRGPDRFASLVFLALAVLAAVGATWLWQRGAEHWPRLRRYAIVCTAIVALLGLADVGARLMPTIPVDRSEATLAPYRWIAAHAPAGPVAEFPVETTATTTAYYSTYHWHPVIWGHSGFIPPATYHLLGRFAGRTPYPAVVDLGALADLGVRTVVIHRSALLPGQIADMESQYRDAPQSIALMAYVGDASIYQIIPPPNVSAVTAHAVFSTNAFGNLDKLTGEVTVTNPGPETRMLYKIGKFDLIAVVRDAAGKEVSRQPIALTPPAVIPQGTTTFPVTVILPRKPGDYTVALLSDDMPALQAQTRVTVHVVDFETLPHLTLTGSHVTSPPLFEPGETVAMWVTTKDGTTVPLKDTIANNDRTIDVNVGTLPAGAAQVVAHGKRSGIELWVSPP